MLKPSAQPVYRPATAQPAPGNEIALNATSILDVSAVVKNNFYIGLSIIGFMLMAICVGTCFYFNKRNTMFTSNEQNDLHEKLLVKNELFI